MAGPSSYSVASYGAMVACEPRMSAYAAALRESVKPGCMVIDIGAGPGVFSLLACQYGAGSVVAIEPDDSVELLRQLARDNGCESRITVVQGLSTDFEPPAKADVIVSDIRGCLPLFENHVATIVDARARLLAPGGKLIPARDTLRIALVESPVDRTAVEEPWNRNAFGLDLTAGSRFAANSWSKVKLAATSLLSDSAELATIDYYTVSDPDLAASAELTVTRPGSIHGIAVWFDAELAPGIGYSNAPGEPPQVYGQSFLPLEHAVDALPGDCLSVEITANLVNGSYVWGWNSSFHRAGSDQPEFRFRQSSFLGTAMSPQSLRLRSADYCPPARDAHEVDRFCLSLIDGQRSHGAIADQLRARFPKRFPSFAKAVDHVASLTARYR